MEIERKYLIKKERLPQNLDTFPHLEIEQAYLCTEPVVRIRRQDTAYYLTYSRSCGRSGYAEVEPYYKSGVEDNVGYACYNGEYQSQFGLFRRDEKCLEYELQHKSGKRA